MNDIKSRMKSVESTMQITKAMELVATSKLRRAKERAERARAYYEVLFDIAHTIARKSKEDPSIWNVAPSGNRKTLYIVVAGDRGLAGGYNSNIFRLVSSLSKDKDAVILPLGKKSTEFYKHRGYDILSDSFSEVANTGVGDSIKIAELVSNSFKERKFERVILVYTKFISMLSQIPTHEEILPFTHKISDNTSISNNDLYIEEDIEEMLDKIIPQYLSGIIYCAICESVASESGARRSAMSSANKNAEEIIGSLVLKYNRARQAVITQEITEIVSGSEAL